MTTQHTRPAWALHFPPDMIDEMGIQIGSRMGLNVYSGEPREVGKVVSIEPHRLNLWPTDGFLVTLDRPRPWTGGPLDPGPGFWEWAVLPPDTWATMTYDEQRALLGLPDVRAYVAMYGLKRQMRGVREVFEQFAQAIVVATKPMRAFVSAMQTDYAYPTTSSVPPSLRGKQHTRRVPMPSRTPPMWAIDASRARRPRKSHGQPNSQGIA